MFMLREAQQQTIDVILGYASRAQEITKQNGSSLKFRRDLSLLIQQLAFYCKEIEEDWKLIRMESKSQDNRSNKYKATERNQRIQLGEVFSQWLQDRESKKSQNLTNSPKIIQQQLVEQSERPSDRNYMPRSTVPASTVQDVTEYIIDWICEDTGSLHEGIITLQ